MSVRTTVRTTPLFASITAIVLCVLTALLASAPALAADPEAAPVATVAAARGSRGRNSKKAAKRHAAAKRIRVSCRTTSARRLRSLRRQGRCTARQMARPRAGRRPAQPGPGNGSGGNAGNGSGSGNGGDASNPRGDDATPRGSTPRAPTPRAPTPRAPTPRAPTPAPRAPTPAPNPEPTTPTPAPTNPTPAPNPPTPGGAQGYNGFGVGNWPGADWRPFAASSPWNQPVGSAAVHANSAAFVQKVMSWAKPGPLTAGVSGSTKDYGHPTYYAQPDDPIFTLNATSSRNELQGMRIRVPDAARAAGGSDGHMTIVQPDGWTYDLWQVQSKPSGGGTLSFSIGGRSRIDGNGTDGRATAGNFPNLAGVIRAQELAAGRIDHALFLVLRCTTGTTDFGFGTTAAPSSSQGAFVYPATHGGSRCDDPNVPPMGTRFTLALSGAQIDALAVPAWKKTILRALATYGAYVGDTGGAGFSFQFESSATYTSFGVADPLVNHAKSAGLRGGSGDWAGTYTYDMASGVDWARYLRVVAPPQPGATAAAKRRTAS